jgi:hypothetical protein
MVKRFISHPLALAGVAAGIELAAYVSLRATWHAAFGPQPSIAESSGVSAGYALLIAAGFTSSLVGSASAYRAVLTLKPAVAAVFVVCVAAPVVFAATAATYATLALLALI